MCRWRESAFCLVPSGAREPYSQNKLWIQGLIELAIVILATRREYYAFRSSILAVTHFIFLAVDVARSQEIECLRRASPIVCAFLFHTNQAELGLVFAIVLRQPDVISSQCVRSVPEICLRGRQELGAGDPGVLLGRGGR